MKKQLCIMIFFFLCTVFLSMQGCSGGGGDGEDDEQNYEILTGTFVDAAVQGLAYQTATQSGITDSQGTFQYLAGESISFSIGSINLGQGTAKDLMTPVDLVAGATGAENSTVVNKIRFLQTLDDDDNPTNGIIILDAVRNAAASSSVDFEVCVLAFENDMANNQLLQTLTGLTSDGERELCDIDEALDHFGDVAEVYVDSSDVDMDGDGYTENQEDCDETNAAVNPGAVEICDDQIDNDCDDVVDQNCISCTDGDEDGYFAEGGNCGTADCDDNDSGIYPGAVEICDDSIDQDCNGADLACSSGGEITTDPPASTVKLIFIHHSTGGNWLADAQEDPYGGLGTELMNNNYYVSATNYGWGPDNIGDDTDIPYWPDWFTGPNRSTYMAALYAETGQNIGGFGAWSRLSTDPGGENEIIMFKSCFPNSDLTGNPDDPPLAAPHPSDDNALTVENVKAVYNNILTYFTTKQDKFFVVITAPPLMESETSADRAANARAFNNWLINDWLAGYQYNNVMVFDYYNVLTDPDNHHRWNNGAVQHEINTADNFSAYPTDDSHPSTIGHSKATEEFVPLLNYYYNLYKGNTGGGGNDASALDY